MKEIVLEFDGYWTEEALDFLPNKSGVYCVYRGLHHPLERKVRLRELLYIGESARVRHRIKTHERKKEWLEHLKPGETLCYSFAPILIDRNWAEAALVHQHKPTENWDHVYDFPYPDVALFVMGDSLMLSGSFAVLERSRDYLEREVG